MVGESQSRYGIMEKISQQKIKAQNKLAEIEKDIKIQTLNAEKQKRDIENKINNEESNYENNFKSWKANKEFELENLNAEFLVERKTMEQEHQRNIKRLTQQITDRENKYKDDHKQTIENLRNSMLSGDENVKDFLTIKHMEIDALKDEIKGYEETIADLKEVSKESTKKD